MTNEQIKEKLLKLNSEYPNFTVIQSGKKSKKVNGLYKRLSKEIVLHNMNFENESELLYTAIHELAHHVHISGSLTEVTSRSHTIEFRRIFHELLLKAEMLGIYSNLFKTHQDFIDLTKDIKENYLALNVKIMQGFAFKLAEAAKLCNQYHVRYEDYLERELLMSQSLATAICKVGFFNFKVDLPPDLGFENLKSISSLKPADQEHALGMLKSGASIDMVKSAFSKSKQQQEMTPLEVMQQEKERIISQIDRLKRRLEKLEKKMKSEPVEVAELADRIGHLTTRLHKLQAKEKRIITQKLPEDTFLKMLSKWLPYISGNAIKVLICLHEHGPELSLGNIQVKTGLKINTIKGCLASLAEEKIIKQQRIGSGRGITSLYFIN